jgi:hypothetical protein
MFKKDIAEKIINTEIENGIPFIIISIKWELAMAVSPEKIYGTYWKLVVITVFRQSEIHQFRVGIDQIVIEK